LDKQNDNDVKHPKLKVSKMNSQGEFSLEFSEPMKLLKLVN